MTKRQVLSSQSPKQETGQMKSEGHKPLTLLAFVAGLFSNQTDLQMPLVLLPAIFCPLQASKAFYSDTEQQVSTPLLLQQKIS